MSQRLILLSLLICWPTILAAKDIKVKAGEHEEFSRLVVYTSRSDRPALTRTAEGFRVTSGNDADRFRTNSVFDMIPRDRIADLTSRDGGGLDIIVNCPCDAVTQTLPGGQFVIDIVDAPERQEPIPSQNGQFGLENPKLDNQPSALHARRGLPIAGVIAGVSDGSEALETLKQPALEGAGDPSHSGPAPVSLRPLTEKSLLEQLARAASQGLLDAPLIPDPPVSDKSESTPRETQPLAAVETPALEFEPPSATDHISIQTSVDRDADRSTSISNAPDNSSVCLPAQSFTIADWGGNDQENLDFATYRDKLTTELDRLDPDIFRSFIQHQIYLTLGAEAQSYLKRYRGILTDDDDLQLMAEIVDTGSAAGHARMATQLTCDGPVALWAVLSQPRLPRDLPINTAAVISEFSILPRHLRTLLGPMAMRKFLAIGDTDTSIEINRITQRGIETSNTDNTLAEAQLSLETGQNSEARDRLTEIVETDDQNAVDAILLLIENHIATQTGIPDRTLELLTSLAHENKASAKGVDLAIAEVRGLIHSARFGDVQAKLRTFDRFPDRNNDRHLQILNEFGMALTNSAADGVFLRNIIGSSMWADADEETRISIADRLLGLGFTAATKDILTNQPTPPGREARVLIAKAVLRDGQAKVALGYLIGLNDAESQKLRETAQLATDQKAARGVPTDRLSHSFIDDPDAEISLEAYETMIQDSKTIRARIEEALQRAPTS